MQLYQSVEDFISDESFQDFVLNPNSQHTNKWETYINQHSDQLVLINEAKEFITLLGNTTGLSPKPLPTSTKNKAPYKVITLISILLGLLFLSIFYWYTKGSTTTFDPVSYASLENKKDVILEDGSLIVLFPHSEILVNKNWDESRHVKLNGDAFFSVESNKDFPFSVETTEGLISVKGTEFDVLSSTSFEVILHEGSIEFQKDRSSTLLKPNQSLKITNDKIEVKEIDASSYAYWRKDKLSFKDVELSEIITILDRSYGIQVKVEDKSLMTKRITAHLPQNDPILMLTAIAEIYSLKLSEEGDVYKLQ